MVEYEKIRPDAPDLQEEPDTARILDETCDFIAAHVVADDNALRVATLFAGMSWGKEAFATIPRLLIKTREPGLEGKNHGKTTFMNVIASVCASPADARGTYAALRAELAEAAAEGGYRTFFRDRIEQVYGTSGLNIGSNTTLTSLLEGGYKEDAYDSWSVNRSKQRFSLFYPVIMTANGLGLSSDILERCVVVNMPKGRPRRFFSVRESQAEAKDLGRALGAAVREHLPELAAFRAASVDEKKLVQRLAEIWESLFAVAWVLGGQRWLNWCLEAFRALALDSESSALSPRQQVLRDAAGLLDDVLFLLPSGREFAEGVALARRMILMDNEIYQSKTLHGMTMLISESMPVRTKQVRIGKERLGGYYADDIRKAWADIKPEDPRDAEFSEEENPFAVTAVSDDDFDEVFDSPDPASNVRAVRAVRAGKTVKKGMPRP